MNGITRVALYARVSSQKQADERTIQSQLHELIQRVHDDGLDVHDDFQFCDDGYSGSALLRPALETLRDQIASSMIDRLYIHSADRLARKFSHQAILLEEFSRHECQVVFLNQHGMPDSPETSLLIQMQGMIAEYEREKILERTRRGRRYAAAQGRVSVFARAPYGYTYITKHDGHGEARLEIHPEESQAVELMFDLVANQHFTLSRVCRELESRGIPTRTGRPRWSPCTVRGILKNPACYGEARYGKKRLAPRKPGKRVKRGDPTVPRQTKVAVATSPEEQVTIRVPAIISRTVFDQVNERLEENRRHQRSRQNGPMTLLSGLLVCGECGSAYCSHRFTKRDYFYYRCIGGDKYRRPDAELCRNQSLLGHKLEAKVWSEVCALLRDPSRLERELTRRRDESLKSPSELAESERRLKELRGRLDRLIDAYAAGLLEQSEFEIRINPLRAQYDRESSALTSLRGSASADSVESATEQLRAFSESVTSHLSEAQADLKRELCELLIARIEIHSTEIRIVYKVPSPPFPRSPASRGLFQHCWRRPEKPST